MSDSAADTSYVAVKAGAWDYFGGEGTPRLAKTTICATYDAASKHIAHVCDRRDGYKSACLVSSAPSHPKGPR